MHICHYQKAALYKDSDALLVAAAAVLAAAGAEFEPYVQVIKTAASVVVAAVVFVAISSVGLGHAPGYCFAPEAARAPVFAAVVA